MCPPYDLCHKKTLKSARNVQKTQLTPSISQWKKIKLSAGSKRKTIEKGQFVSHN